MGSIDPNAEGIGYAAPAMHHTELTVARRHAILHYRNNRRVRAGRDKHQHGTAAEAKTETVSFITH